MPNLSTSGPVSAPVVSPRRPEPLSSPTGSIFPAGSKSAFRSHMKTTRVRSIAAAARGSTLLLPLDALGSSAQPLSMSPINLPWASLLSSNPHYPSIDVTEEQTLIGRKPPCQLVVNHQAISGIHCRLYRKTDEQQQQTAESSSLQSVGEEEGEEEGEGEEAASRRAAKPVEEEKEAVSEADSLIEDKNKRRSRIKVSEMISFLGPAAGHAADEQLVWKGTKNAEMTAQRLDAVKAQQAEIWLEDLSTNGTFIGGDVNAVKIGSCNKVRVRHGSEFTLLQPGNGNAHERITYSLRINGASPVGDMDDAPTGTVTMVFTDIESSTNLWEACPSAMQAALEEHDRTLRTLLARFRGYEVKTEGDAFMVAFFTVLDAVKWCLAVQEALLRMKWDSALLKMPSARREFVDSSTGQRTLDGPDTALLFNGLRIRMGLHVGQPSCRRNPTTKRMDYFGQMVNLAARVSDSGHGGQIVCTEEVTRIVIDEVAREKEKAEREWAEEREEEGGGHSSDDDDSDDEADAADGDAHSSDLLDPAAIPHHRANDSITPPTSHHGTANKAAFEAAFSEHNRAHHSLAVSPKLGPAQPKQPLSPRSLRSPRSPLSPSGPAASAQSTSPARPPMNASRFNRIRSAVHKKPSTLDHTLESLTDLSAVTFDDCGFVQLKGIKGGTKVFQVASLSLIGRKWEPALRAKPVKPEVWAETVVGEEAPAAPPLAPVTVTLYDKHSIPLQIRRNILRNRRRERKESRLGNSISLAAVRPLLDAEAIAEVSAAALSITKTDSKPDSKPGTPSSLKSGGSRRIARSGVRFAEADEVRTVDSIQQAVEEKTGPAAELTDAKDATVELVEQQTAEPAELPTASAVQKDNATAPLPSSAFTPRPAAPVVVHATPSRVSALARAFQVAADVAPAALSPVSRRPGPVAVPNASIKSASAEAEQTATPAAQNASAACVAGGAATDTAPPPVSSVLAPSTSAPSTSAQPALSPRSSSVEPVPLGAVSVQRSVSTPPTPTPASKSLAQNRSVAAAPAAVKPSRSADHRRSLSSAQVLPCSSDALLAAQRRAVGAGEADRAADALAAVFCAAFDMEARQARGLSAGSNASDANSQWQPAKLANGQPNNSPHRLQPRRYSTLRPTPSSTAYSAVGLPTQPAVAVPQPLPTVDMQLRMLSAEEQQQAHAVGMLHYHQARQAYVQQLLQQRQQPSQQPAAAMQHFWPPAQTPSFGLSPSVSSAVPYSYSFPNGTQWNR